MKYTISVVTKAPGTLTPTMEHTLAGDAWTSYDDEHWTVVATGTPMITEDGGVIEVDEHEVEEEYARVQVPTEHVLSITVGRTDLDAEGRVKPPAEAAE